MRFCAQWFMTFHAPSSSSPGAFHTVTFIRGEGGHCTCKAYEHWVPRNPGDIRECKHIRYVMQHACLANEQWYSGGDRTLQPVPDTCTEHANTEEPCPACGGSTVRLSCGV